MRTRWNIAATVAVTALLVGVVWVAPGSAHTVQKIFSLNVPASLVSGATGVQYQMTFKNETPNGNSSIDSLKAKVTSGVTITNATAPSGWVTFTANQVSISHIAPVKNGQTFVVTLTLDVGQVQSCTGSSVSWTAQAWTGSSFSGDTFKLLTTEINPKTGLPYSQLVSQVSASCVVRFVPGRTPANAVRNAVITSADGSTVQAELLQGGVRAGWFIGTVSIDATSAPQGAILSGNSVSAVGGLASFPALSADTVGDYTVHASALNLTGDPASFSVYADGITCGQTVDGSSEDGTAIDLTRTDAGGQDGCQEIPYTLTVSHDLVTLLKDQALVRSQGATFEAVITWPDPVGQYPDFGMTTIDVDGDGPIPPFVPENCDVVDGVAQYPQNPNGNGDYWPAPGTVEPWCVASVDIHPLGDVMVATETFLGSGDPSWQRQ